MSHTVGTRSFFTEPIDLVLLIILEITFNPVPLAFGNIAFPGKNVRTRAIQEPPIVGDHDGAPWELLESVLQAGESFDIQIVGGLIQ